MVRRKFRLEFDVVDTDNPRKDLCSDGEVNVLFFVRSSGSGFIRVVFRNARMTYLAEFCYGKFVDVVADNSKLHRTHDTVIEVVIMTVPVIIVAIVTPFKILVFASLINGYIRISYSFLKCVFDFTVSSRRFSCFVPFVPCIVCTTNFFCKCVGIFDRNTFLSDIACLAVYNIIFKIYTSKTACSEYSNVKAVAAVD